MINVKLAIFTLNENARDFTENPLFLKWMDCRCKGVNVTKNSRGKPILSSGKYLSIAHKKKVAVAAYSKNPVGVDIEFLEEICPKKISKRLFGYEISDPLDFYRQFTIFESKYKLGFEGENVKTHTIVEDNMVISVAGTEEIQPEIEYIVEEKV